MFKFALVIGLYSYLIFFLGIFGYLYKEIIIASSLIFAVTVFIFNAKDFKNKSFKLFNFSRLSKTSIFLVSLIGIQSIVNLIGVLGPELSFDSLWYHLTLPKLYLENHYIFHIPGGLLYYSDVPKLGEMLYLSGLSVGSEVIPKLINFFFLLFILFCIFKLSRKFLSVELSVASSLIFYSSLVVGWEAITAYVDIIRAGFELTSFFAFVIYFEKRQKKWFYISASLLGFAITTKVVAVFSLFIFLGILLWIGHTQKESLSKSLIKFLRFSIVSLAIPFPWFLYSFINTGNPIYPYFSLPVDSGKILSFPYILDLKTLFLTLSDPISPIYLILLPYVVFCFKSFTNKQKIFVIYSFLAFSIWFVTQEQRGSRFLLPYLPVFSILCSLVIYKIKDISIKNFSISIIVLISIISIMYRGFANAKYIPVLTGAESKSEFLAENLNFGFGDFYDIDGYFSKNIKASDRVLLYGFHNLYYINFPYIDSSWVKEGDKFNYIATQNIGLPKRFSGWSKIYYNDKTKVSLYIQKGVVWEY